MTERVTIAGELNGVLARPSGDAKAPAVVVIHEWWGINEQIETIAKGWAEEGFVALVPDLFHGKTAKDTSEAQALMSGLDFGKAVQEIAASVEYLRARSNGKVAVSGYCLGGALAFATAVNVRGLSAVVPYYGLPGDLDWAKVDAPIQAHFAKHDDWATVAGAEKIKAAVTGPMELHIYDAQHAFCNQKRPEVFNADACKEAWGRSVAFARAHTS